MTRRWVMSSCALLRARDLFGGRDLCAERGFGDGGGHHVRGQREVAGLERVSLVVGLRLQRLDLAADAAENIERVGDVHARAVQGVEIGAIAGQAERGQRGLRRAAPDTFPSARIKRAALGGDVLVGLREPPARLRGWGCASSARSISPLSSGDSNSVHHCPGMSMPSTKRCASPPATGAGGGLGQRLVFGQIRIGIARRRGLEIRARRRTRRGPSRASDDRMPNSSPARHNPSVTSSTALLGGRARRGAVQEDLDHLIDVTLEIELRAMS